MGGLLSKETECMKECKMKCAEQKNNSNSGNETEKKGLMDSVKGKLGEATNAIKNKFGGKEEEGSSEQSQLSQNSSAKPMNQNPIEGSTEKSQGQPQSPPSMSGGSRKSRSKRKNSRKRKMKRLKIKKRSYKKNRT